MRVRRRIALLLGAGFAACAAVLVAALLLGTGRIATRTQEAYRREFLELGREDVGATAGLLFSSIERLRAGGRGGVADIAELLGSGDALRGQLLVYAPDGRLLAGGPPEPELAALLEPAVIADLIFAQRLADSGERVRDNVGRGDTRLAIVRLRAWPDMVAAYGRVLHAPEVRLAWLRDEDRRALLHTGLGSALAALAGLALIAVLLDRSLRRHLLLPLEAVTRAVERLEAGAPAEPLPPAVGDTELALLARSFQAMAARIAERRSQLEALVAERTAALQATLDALPDLLFEVDAAGVILDYRCPPAQPLFVPPERFLGRPLSEVLPAGACAVVMAAIAEAQARGVSASCIYQLPFPDGERHFELAVARKTSAQGLRFITLVRDITERQRLAGELQAARDQAERASQAKSVFLASMSHEIRTPLNAVLGYAQLLARASNLDERQRRQLGILQRSADHLLALLQDVLEISRIESRRVEVAIAPCDLRGLLADVADMLGLKAREAGLALAVEVAPELPALLATDVGKLRQILINLVGNAVKYTRQGAVTVQVRWQSAPAGSGLVEIDVRDTGPGIGAEDCARIFTPFTQAGPRPGGQDGAGLGLAISRGFAEAMGGRLGVVSRPGAGSIFTLTLPMAVAAAAAPAPASAATDLPSGLRVLAVDDQSANRALLSDVLGYLGCSVVLASDGEEALALLARQDFAVVLMDLRMPGLDGLETTRRLRADPRWRRLPVIALTGGVTDEETREAVAAGCDAFLGKPFALEALQRCIAKVL